MIFTDGEISYIASQRLGRLATIQPSGELHIGNYLGAVKNWGQLQHQFESFFCVVNYHAITAAYDPSDLARLTSLWIAPYARRTPPSPNDGIGRVRPSPLPWFTCPDSSVPRRPRGGPNRCCARGP